MAIVNLGAKRLQGTKSDRKSDSLGSSGDGTNSGITLLGSGYWLYQDNGFKKSTNGGNYYRTGYRAIGSTLNTNWVLRFRFKPKNLNSNSGNIDGDGLGLFITDRQYDENVNDTGVGTTKAIGYLFRYTGSQWKYAGYSGTSSSTTSGIIHDGNNQSYFTDYATVDEEYYVEIIKNGTAVTVTQRTGSHTGTLVETETRSSSLSGFTHICAVSFDGNGSTQPNVSCEIKDIELWDNATSASGSATLTENFSGSTFTVATGTTIEAGAKLGTGAYSFDGSNDKVLLGSASDWKFLSDATANTWSIAWWMIYNDTLENGHTIMSTTDGSTQNDGFFIDNSGSGTLRLIQVDGDNGTWSSAIPDNTSWHHYAITWNAGTVTLYVDGVSKGTQSQTAGSGTPQYPLTFGANNDEYFTALTLDDLGIWKRVLTATEIQKLYNNNGGGTAQLVSSLSNKAGLKANYTMDGTTGTVVDDDLSTDSGWVSTVTGNGYDATNDRVNFKLSCPPDSSSHAGGRVIIDVQDADWLNGSNMPDNFTARFKWRVSAMANASANENRSYMGFFSSDAWGGTSQDSFYIQFWTNTSGIQTFRCECINGGTFQGGSENRVITTLTPSLNTDYYIELKKAGNTHTYRITTNSDYTGGTTATVTQSGIEDLRYFGFKSRGDNQNNGGNNEGYIDDITITNDSLCANDHSSTADLTLYDTPTNTIFEQTDDTPSYWWKQSDNTWSLDGNAQQEPSLTDSATWSMVGKQTGSATTTLTGGKLRYVQATNHGTADSGAVAVFDTGGTTDKFIIRFNITTGSSHTDGGGNAVIYWGLSSQGSYSSSHGFVNNQSQDGVFFRWHIYSNKTRIGYHNDGSISWGTDPNENLTFTNSTTYYFELSFDGSTTTLKRFTDSTYNSATHTGTQTSVSNVSDLRYFVLGGTIDSQMGVFTIDHNKFEIQKGRSTWLE